MQLLPQTDLVEFLRLPERIRKDVEAWQEELSRLAPPIQVGLELISHRMGVSAKTARNRWDAWRRSGGSWRSLIDRRSVGDRAKLSPEFIDYWRGLCEANKRKISPAYREFVRQWRAGWSIPGVPLGFPRHTMPRGFSLDNLRRFSPTPFELTATRVGRGAAAAFRPLVFTTRVGMEVGQRYLIDDVWHDFKVVVLGQRGARRLLQLHALDLFSGCQFARGMKPRVEDPETGRSVGLNEGEAVFLCAHMLETFGYHPSGTVIMGELGTATLNDQVVEMLAKLSGGTVTFDASGAQSASAFGGQYCGRSKGNFRFKAALESFHNLLHNETANALEFPGQTGSNSRVNAPEELHGRERHVDLLCRVMMALPERVRNELRLPMLESRKAMMLVDEISERINQRTDHELEGWLEAGLTTVDFDLDGHVINGASVMLMDPVKRAAIEAAGTPIARKLSPREVFNAGRGRLIKFRPEQTAMLLASCQTRSVRVRNHLIEFEDAAISPAPLRYLAHHFRDGDEFAVVVNPFSPHVAFLFDAQNRWVGQVNAWQTVSRLDAEALHAQMGAAAAVERELLQPIARRGAAFTEQRRDISRHNSSIIQGEAGFESQAGDDADEALGNLADS